MIHLGASSSNPSFLIKDVDAPILNWHAALVPPANVQPNPDVYPLYPLVVSPHFDVIEASFDEVLNDVFPINEIREDFEYLDVPYINCLDSNQTLDDDDFANEQFLTDLSKVNNK